MEPIPETLRADREFGPFDYENHDLLEHLTELGSRVRLLAPDCVGMSLTLVEQGVTFTVVATDRTTTLLDATQYVDDGPCQTALDTQRAVGQRAGDPLDEERWSLFAAASSAHGVASTLSFPVVLGGTTVAGFNLYGATRDAFAGLGEQLAALLGAWAPGAVTDADLSFGTLQVARRAPELLRDSTRLSVATALLSQARSMPLEEAEDRLRSAAVRAAVPLPQLVDVTIEVLRAHS